MEKFNHIRPLISNWYTRLKFIRKYKGVHTTNTGVMSRSLSNTTKVSSRKSVVIHAAEQHIS